MQWCRWRDSNSHSFRHRPLKTACLPIPPHRPIISESIKNSLDTEIKSNHKQSFNYSGISPALEAASLTGSSAEGVVSVVVSASFTPADSTSKRFIILVLSVPPPEK